MKSPDLFPHLLADSEAVSRGLVGQLRVLAQEFEEAPDISAATNPKSSLRKAFKRVMASLETPVDTWKPVSGGSNGLLLLWVSQIELGLKQVDEVDESFLRLIELVTEKLTRHAQVNPEFHKSVAQLLTASEAEWETETKALSSLLHWPCVGKRWSLERRRERMEDAWEIPSPRQTFPRM